MSEVDPYDQHPIWEGAIAGFLFAVEQGLVSRDDIIPVMSQTCAELLQDGMLSNLGELQAYLRERDSVVQLVAQPFDSAHIRDPNLRCIDILTHEPRGHYLTVAVSGTTGSEVNEHLHRLFMSPEVNEATLARDTGMLAIVEQ